MHIVYFHPDKLNGYGATQESRWPKRLIEQDLDVSKGRIIEQGLTLEEASDRERELQLRDGYPTDAKPYSYIMNILLPKSNTPQAIGKMLKNTDQVEKGKLISKALTGRVLTKEWKDNISKALLGKTIPLEVRKKISETSKKWTGDRGLSKRKHPIVQMDLNYNPIKIWECANDVRHTIPGMWESAIGDRCKGKTDKPYKGYHWKYYA